MNRLKDLRNDNDLSQKEIGQLLGVADNSYSRYEAEIINISTKHLKKLANYYNVSIDYIFFRTDIRNSYKESIYQNSNDNELNMPFRTYLKYENMTRPLNTLILNIFADYFNTSIDYIIFNTDEIKPHKKSIVDWKVK